MRISFGTVSGGPRRPGSPAVSGSGCSGLIARPSAISEKSPRTYEKGGQSLPFPDVEADDFSEVRRGSRYRVMAYEEKWHREFHDAIASDSAQALMEAMSSVAIPGKPGELLTRVMVCSAIPASSSASGSQLPL